MPDVGKQTQPIEQMPCPRCKKTEGILRLPRDMSKKESYFQCSRCGHVEEFP